MERLIHIHPDLEDKIPAIVKGLRKMGVIERGDEVMVGADSSLESGRKSTQVRVDHVYRDGDSGPIDTVPEIYRVRYSR